MAGHENRGGNKWGLVQHGRQPGGQGPGWVVAGPLPGKEVRAQAPRAPAAIPGMTTGALGPPVNLRSTRVGNEGNLKPVSIFQTIVGMKDTFFLYA